MKIKIAKKSLDLAIQTANIALGGGDESKLEAHLLFRYNPKDEALTMLAQNGARMLCSVPLADAVVEGVASDAEEVLFTVPGDRMRKWLAAVDQDEVVTLTPVDGHVKVTSKRGSGKLGSLNPKDFPFWDQTLSEAVETATTNCAYFASVLSYLRNFVSVDESRYPNLLGVGANGLGSVIATDRVGASRVRSDVFNDCHFSINGKDIPAVLSFLGVKGAGGLVLKEHDRCLFLQRENGSVLGVTKWASIPFEKVKDTLFEQPDPHPNHAVLSVADIQGGLKFLSAFAKKDDILVRFRFETGKAVFSMCSATGASGEDEQVVPLISETGMDIVSTKGKGYFFLSKTHLEVVAASATKPEITMGVTASQASGYSSFRLELPNGDAIDTILMWIPK